MNLPNQNKDRLVARCVDLMLLDDDELNQMINRKRPADAAGIKAPKRSRQNNIHGREANPETSDSSSDEDDGEQNAEDQDVLLVDLTQGNNDQQGQAPPPAAAAATPTPQETIIGMFPWINRDWVAEQINQDNFDLRGLIERILTGKNIPKKEKPKPQAESIGSSKVSGESGSGSGSPVAENFLKDFSVDFRHLRNPAAMFLAQHFPWIRMDNFDRVLRHFNFHVAPAYKVIHEAINGVNFDMSERPKFIAVKIVQSGKPEISVNLSLIKNRRIVDKERTYPVEMHQEIAWMEKHFNLETSKSTVSMIESQRDLKLKRAQEVGDFAECGVCFCEYILSEEMVRCGRGCLFCKDCLRRYAEESVYGQGKAQLTCMNDDCDSAFSPGTLMKNLDETLLKKLDERSIHENINLANIEGLEWCKHCGYALIFDVPPNVNKVFKCDVCENEYCRICKVDWEGHMGKLCKEVETEDETRQRREAEEKMAAAIIRQCKRCKTQLIKEEGCNRVACKCGAFMCYICREEITLKDPYEHFCRHPKSPGQPRCQHCDKCMLFEDAKVKDLAQVNKIQDEINQAFADAGKQLVVGAAKEQRPKFVSSRQGPALGNVEGQVRAPPPQQQQQ